MLLIKVWLMSMISFLFVGSAFAQSNICAIKPSFCEVPSSTEEGLNNQSASKVTINQCDTAANFLNESEDNSSTEYAVVATFYDQNCNSIIEDPDQEEIAR